MIYGIGIVELYLAILLTFVAVISAIWFFDRQKKK